MVFEAHVLVSSHMVLVSNELSIKVSLIMRSSEAVKGYQIQNSKRLDNISMLEIAHLEHAKIGIATCEIEFFSTMMSC